MRASGTKETASAHYDDAPGHQAGNPLIRLVRVAGCVLTVIMGGTIAAVRAVGVHVSPDVFAVCGVISVASIPLIMLFWSEEVAWRGGRLAILSTLFAVSVLTWFAQIMLAVFMMFGVSIILG